MFAERVRFEDTLVSMTSVLNEMKEQFNLISRIFKIMQIVVFFKSSDIREL